MTDQAAQPTDPDAVRIGPLRHTMRALAIAAPLFLIALLAYGVLSKSPDTRIDDSLAQGRPVPAPQFDLAVLQRGTLGSSSTPQLISALNAGRLTLRELRGIPVVMNIWASWCIPCRQEAPLLERTWRTEGRPRGVLFVGLDTQDVTGDALAFLHGFHIDYLNIRDPTNDVPLSYGVTGVPETFFIDRSGRIVGHVIGETNATELRDGTAASLSGQVVGARRGGSHRPSR